MRDGTGRVRSLGVPGARLSLCVDACVLRADEAVGWVPEWQWYEQFSAETDRGDPSCSRAGGRALLWTEKRA